MGERTGWRDEKLSEMHRLWGETLHFMDIDSIWVECDGKKCVAFIEYKCEKEASEWQLEVLRDAARERPAFVVRYSDDGRQWKVAAINPAGRRLIPEPSILGPADFVRFQYRVRGKMVDDTALSGFMAEMGWWWAGT